MSVGGYDYPDYSPGGQIKIITLTASGNIDGMDSTGMSAGQIALVLFTSACVLVNAVTVVSPILPWALGSLGPEPNLALTAGSRGLFAFENGTWEAIAAPVSP
jgi:hypothetical protein